MKKTKQIKRVNKKLIDRVHQLEAGIQAAIDNLDSQPVLTPDEDALLEQLQRIQRYELLLKGIKCSID